MKFAPVYLYLIGVAWLPAQVTKLPVVFQPQGMDGIAVKSATYLEKDGKSFTVDFYLPPDLKEGQVMPAVIFNNGVGAVPLPQWRVYQDWGRLVALRGMIGINYQADDGDGDTRQLLKWLAAEGTQYGVNARRMALWSCSGNVHTGLPILMDPNTQGLHTAVILYGMTREEVTLRRDISLLMVRAGRDIYDLNRRMNQFTAKALARDLDVETINYPEGHHAFDIVDDTPRSKWVIQQILDFLEQRLMTLPKTEALVLTSADLYHRLLEDPLEPTLKLLETEYQANMKRREDGNIFAGRNTSSADLSEVAGDLAKAGKFDQALALLTTADRLHEDSPWIANGFAHIYEQQGNREEALRFNEKTKAHISSIRRKWQAEEMRETVEARAARLKTP